MTWPCTILLFFLLSWCFEFGVGVIAIRHRHDSNDDDLCDPRMQRKPEMLRSDQVTVLINGYSESRIPLLISIAASYAASPVVSSVVVLWGNPNTQAHLLHGLSLNLSSSSSSAPISLIQQSTSSLNARFLPRPELVETRGVLVCDDDVEVDTKSVEFAFRVWASNPERLVGLFVRSHDMDMSRKEWIYTVHPDRYSIILTKFMLLRTEYLYTYSCMGGEAMARMRRVVEEMHNCEDILMNFVVAEEINAGPLLVGAQRVRDYGDARNEDEEVKGEVKLMRIREAGLSSQERGRGEHRKRRGQCIMEFHRIVGRMPLRYSYGKVVNSVEEQGLCLKGSRLVFCNQFFDIGDDPELERTNPFLLDNA